VERNFRKINQNFQLFLKNKKTSKKNNFYKLKNWKKIKKKLFHEIRAKKVRSEMNQQQNGQCRKGPQQNRPCQKDVLRLELNVNIC